MRTTLAAFSLALLVGTAPLAADEVAAWRGFVADAQTGAVSIVDLLDGTVLERFELTGPGRLYAGPSGRYAFVVQRAGNQVAVIDSGIAFEDHGDHDDIEITAPALLPTVIEGAEPVHFNTGAGTVAVFFDGDGTAGLWREADLVDGKLEPLASFATAGPLVLVSDPAAGEVVVLEALDLQELRRIAVGGQPFDVLVMGGTGHAH